MNARIVISAMHCFWDKTFDTSYDAALYRIKVGKTYRDYNDTNELTNVQSFAVRKITKFGAYSGRNTDYVGDIAILLLDNYIQFTAYIAPICIDYEDMTVSDKWVGIAAGWGGGNRFDRDPVLGPHPALMKRIPLPVIDKQECKQVYEDVTPDKFCVAHTDIKEGLCLGDSGGGLVSPEKMNRGGTKYFLRGIISTSAPNQRNRWCGGNGSYTGLTNIALYGDFIRRQETEYRPRTSTIGKLCEKQVDDKVIPYINVIITIIRLSSFKNFTKWSHSLLWKRWIHLDPQER